MSEVVVQGADILWTHSKDIANTNMLVDFQMRSEQLHLGVEEAAMRAVFLLRGIGKETRSCIVYRYKKEKQYSFIPKREKKNSMPTARSRVLAPRLGFLLSMEAGEAHGGRKPQASCSSPPTPNTTEASGPIPIQQFSTAPFVRDYVRRGRDCNAPSV